MSMACAQINPETSVQKVMVLYYCMGGSCFLAVSARGQIIIIIIIIFFQTTSI